MQLTTEQIARYTNATIEVAPANPESLVSGITWDSREVTPGCAYLALPGERVDGHTFAKAAIEAGAAAVLAMQPLAQEAYDAARTAGAAVLQVANTNQAITDLARGWRTHLTGQVIALTGSTGKTTTKNLVRDVLATRLATVATKGNQNNELGVPRTLLEAEANTQAIVVEMGMRGLGQLKELCEFVRPNVALITNVGESHIELLGSRENIAHAKAEVLEALQPGGIAVLNAADDFSAAQRTWTALDERGVTVALYDGSGNAACAPGAEQHATGASAWATNISLNAEGQPSFTLHLATPAGESAANTSTSAPAAASTAAAAATAAPTVTEHACTLSLRGAHNVHNACAAAALGTALGLDAQAILEGLSASQAEAGRQEVHTTKNGITVVNDAYNANPDSMQASLSLFAAMDVAGKRFAVLGDMGELGSHAPALHQRVGAFAASTNIAHLVCVGELATHIASAANAADMPAANIHTFATRDEALAYIKQEAAPGDAVLVKASHFMELDRIAKGLLED